MGPVGFFLSGMVREGSIELGPLLKLGEEDRAQASSLLLSLVMVWIGDRSGSKVLDAVGFFGFGLVSSRGLDLALAF